MQGPDQNPAACPVYCLLFPIFRLFQCVLSYLVRQICLLEFSPQRKVNLVWLFQVIKICVLWGTDVPNWVKSLLTLQHQACDFESLALGTSKFNRNYMTQSHQENPMSNWKISVLKLKFSELLWKQSLYSLCPGSNGEIMSRVEEAKGICEML